MQPVNLILSLPQGVITASSLGIDGFAWHKSPGSGSHYRGRSILVDLAITPDLKPEFNYLDEGGWRNPSADTVAALASAKAGKRTKTAVSNNAFSCTPLSAYRRMFLVKTGGHTLELQNAGTLATFRESPCNEGMSPDQIASAIGLPAPKERTLRAYLIFCPIEFIVLSSLTPEEYVWYATHRPGKIFRQVLFTEIDASGSQLAAEQVYQDARKEMENASKKTKTLVTGDAINRVPFQGWLGYGDRASRGGVFVGDRNSVGLWRFPDEIPRNFDKASG
jgi:hypothetical protein